MAKCGQFVNVFSFEYGMSYLASTTDFTPTFPFASFHYFDLFCEFMFMMCAKIEFSTSQRTMTGITLFSDVELSILAVYFNSVKSRKNSTRLEDQIKRKFQDLKHLKQRLF